LLDALGDVKGQASQKAVLDRWLEEFSRGQRDMLQRLFKTRLLIPSVDLPEFERRAEDLDRVLGIIDPDPDAKGVAAFSDSYAYGLNVPSSERQDAFERLFGRSIRVRLDLPPAPFERWLYTALDFEHALVGRLFLLRVIAPEEFDLDLMKQAVDDENEGRFASMVLETGMPQLGPDEDEMEALVLLTDDASKTYLLDDLTANQLGAQIIEATACALFPSQCLINGDARAAAIDEVVNWYGFSASELKTNLNAQGRWPLGMSDLTERRLVQLTNAIAAHRLARMLPESSTCEMAEFCAAVWLHAALDGLMPELDAWDRRAFYRAPRGKKLALQDVLSKMGCWYPPFLMLDPGPSQHCD
jgi:hypothetical protein